MNDLAVEAIELCKIFGDVLAVDRVSLRIPAGATFGLLGPNGAGKSTTIKLLTTISRPSSGTARVAGFDVVKKSVDVRRHIGYVPQQQSADPDLTGYENLLVLARLYGLLGHERRTRIDEALELMELIPARNRLVRHYSGGMVRRLEIAQSMLNEPQVLFMDEPTLGLDPAARRLVWQRVAKLRQTLGTTIFLTTHYMDEAEELCNLVAFIGDGKIQDCGSTRRIDFQIQMSEPRRRLHSFNRTEIRRRERGRVSLASPARQPAVLLAQIAAIADAEIQKLRHDPLELFTRVIQPVLWLVLFGQVFGRVQGIPTGGIRYEDYLVPGILAQSALFIAIFYGISAIWERDLGILYKYLMTPAPRWALVLGKALSAGVRGLSQAVMVYIIALLLGVHLRHDPRDLLGVAGVILVGASIFATFSLIIACIVKTRERFMGIGQVLTMPLFFASNAIYPIALMPPWLRAVATANPLTYQVDALRALMLPGYHLAFSIETNAAVQFGALFLVVAIAAKIYPSILQ